MKTIKNIMLLILGLYLVCLAGLYFNQEKLLFFPTKLSKEYTFKFPNPFEEINLKVADGIELNALLFKSEQPKGVVLFFHGNGGAIHGWGQGASLYVRNNYDVLYVDYRGYGKSDGQIKNEKQLLEDGQKFYDYLKEKYSEEKIIISGTSIGTGIATQIALNNSPKKLILNSPYSSLESLIKEKIEIVPGFLIKYQLDSKSYLKAATFPIIIFHGDKDTIIPYHHSLQLKEINPIITLHILEGFGHNDINQSPVLLKEMVEILN